MSGNSAIRTGLSGALVLLCVGLLAFAAGPLATLPVLLAFVPLLAGRYLGAEAIERLIESRLAATRRRSPRRVPLRRAVRTAFMPRGGSLLASSLAKRPPPLALNFA
jgi:hypothetical protein